jgi:hypothetical protein
MQPEDMEQEDNENMEEKRIRLTKKLIQEIGETTKGADGEDQGKENFFDAL